MLRLNIILLSVSLCFGVLSCKKNRFEIARTSNFPQVKIERFDIDLMSIDTTQMTEQVAVLKEKYEEFFSIYTERIIPVGNENSSDFYVRLKGFVTDSMAREIYCEAQQYLGNVSDIEKELTVAFGYIRHYFPAIEIPRVLLHISGFNQNIVVADGFLSLSEDYYLGADYEPYQYIAYDYQLGNMRREKIATDYILGFLMSEFSMGILSTRLIENLLYRGKIMYLQSVIMPKQSDCVLFGFSPEKMQWCKNNEKEMWQYMLEKKQLYVNDMFTVSKYLNEAPFTTYFGNDSPGQAAVWLGYRVVKQYMDNNKEVTLPQLMEDFNYQQILERSKYKP